MGKEDLDSGKIYDPNIPEIFIGQQKDIERMHKFNKTKSTPLGLLKRMKLLKKNFAEVGQGTYIEPPYYANFGGAHVHLGSYVYANFHLTLVDDGQIFIGDHTMIGPNVTIVTAAHPVLPELREKGLQYNLPVHIGKNVWLGANVMVLPGVTIGDNSVIGAGSLVNKDIPSDVVAFGTPCKVYRNIEEKDREFYHGQMKIPPEMLKEQK